MFPAITIVDDCYELRYLISALVEHEMGDSCLCVGSYAEVLIHAEQILKSRVVVIDINLGPARPDGVDVHKWLKEKAYDGQVFFLTGHAKASPQVQQAALTGVKIFEKPMKPEDIVTLLKDAMAECPQDVRA